MGVDEEKLAFREILRTKPTMTNLAGTDFEDVLCTYVGQKGEAQIFEVGRELQEAFVSVALRRESVMARAEDEGYIPGMPVPFEQEILITNDGENPVLIAYREALLSDDQISVCFNDGGTINPGETITINGLQIYEEVIEFAVQGEIFEEFILGGKDETGIFTIYEYSIRNAGTTWENRQNFRNANKNSEVYHCYYRVSDELAIRFGNGDTGKMPEIGSTVEATIWHTQGERVNIIEGQELKAVQTILDTWGEEAKLTFTTGSVIRSGQPQEAQESTRKHVLSHIQTGPVVARNADYEYMIQRQFPELVYLKVWGEKEMTDEYGDNLDYINKSFFAFLIEDEENTAERAIDIIAYYNEIIKPQNISPENVTLGQNTFQIDIQGKIERKYVPSDVESDLSEILMLLFGKYKNTSGRLKASDIYDIILKTEYFLDSQAHLNRKNKPYFGITLTGIVEATFYDQYVYLSAVTFGDDDGGDTLGYIQNI